MSSVWVGVVTDGLVVFRLPGLPVAALGNGLCLAVIVYSTAGYHD